MDKGLYKDIVVEDDVEGFKICVKIFNTKQIANEYAEKVFGSKIQFLGCFQCIDDCEFLGMIIMSTDINYYEIIPHEVLHAACRAYNFLYTPFFKEYDPVWYEEWLATTVGNLSKNIFKQLHEYQQLINESN